MTRFLKLLAAAAFAVLPFVGTAHAAATAQITHAYLCAQEPAVGAAGSRRVVNTSSTASPQPSYILNNQGCAVINGSDIAFFLSQGFTYGQGVFSLQQSAITASTTASTSTIVLPAYAYIMGIVLSETAGNAITGGVDIGDSGSATRFASAVALSSNATVAVADAALTHVYAPSGVPAADQVLVACHTSCNSGSINITILYSYW